MKHGDNMRKQHESVTHLSWTTLPKGAGGHDRSSWMATCSHDRYDVDGKCGWRVHDEVGIPT